MASQIQIRRDTATNWTSVNPTLAQGEIGFETDTKYFKIGDGSTAWTSLSYMLTQSTGTSSSPTFAGVTADNIRIGITGANEIDTVSGNLTIDSSGGTVTIDDNLTVSGNLTVNGTTTTVNSTITTLDDPIITLGGDSSPESDDNKDRGVEFKWHNGTAAKVGFFGYDDSTGKLTFIPDATNTSEVFSGTLGTIDIGAVHINGSQIAATNLSNGTTGSGSIVLAASPALTGSPTAPTADADTNTTQIATTAFVITQASGTTPSYISSGQYATIGTSLKYARADHTHGYNGLGLTSGTLAQFSATSSSELAGIISDETGSGSLVFSNSPTLTSPSLGNATGSSLSLTGVSGLQKVMVLKADATQSVNIFEIQTSSSTPNFKVSQNFETTIIGGGSSYKTLAVRPGAGSSSDAVVLEVQDESTTPNFRVFQTSVVIGQGYLTSPLEAVLNISAPSGGAGSRKHLFIKTPSSNTANIIEIQDYLSTPNFIINSSGVISTGTWNASLISPTYGGTGVNNGSSTITLGGNLTTSGAYSLTLTQTATTSVTLPTTGTLATLDGSETFTNKTLTTPTIYNPLFSANGGDEGGEIKLAHAVTNSTLSGTSVTIDIYQNRFRIFEAGGTTRGVFIDLSGVSASVGSGIVLDNVSQTLTNKTLTSPVINTPTLTLSTSSSTTDARMSWDATNKKIQVGNGTAVIDFASGTLVTNAQTASYTLALTDKDKLVEISNASANTVTIPLNSSVPFPIGTQITVLQTGSGQTTIAGTGGVTVNATPGLKLRAQWSSVTLIKRATDTWVALGDLQA